ncbi:polyprenyl synthetase family protein [Streptomyces sp. NPDC006739]|uniref:polyprenyl synthetase family protein n=1 Tax=Streptomyces sp. NPDC006739 TaxID=3364763 RepID=UPI00369E5219
MAERPVPRSGAALLTATVDELARRAPAIVAAAAEQLRGIRLGLGFHDGSRVLLSARHSRLVVERPTGGAQLPGPDVEVVFDDRAMNLLFDLEHRPADQPLPDGLDARGPREQVLAVWRAFSLLARRAAGLRSVQELWRSYRDEVPFAGRPREDGREPELVGGTVVTRPRVLWDGRGGSPWWQESPVHDADLLETMAACRARTGEVMASLVPDREPRAELYDLMRQYPSRQGKGLRPTLAIAACTALGGRPEDAVRAAAALELFHNGFLVHDDIADESTHRRGLPTLHEQHGVGLALNCGDGLNLLALDALLSNLETLGLARTLALVHEAVHMCRESVEGQAVELGWISRNVVPERDEAYFTMSTKKTGWYTCITPCRVGAVCAGVTDPALLGRFDEAFRLIGIAFQIRDDLLNLVGQEELYGKELLGDLLEGKRTVMLIHLFRTMSAVELPGIRQILKRPRSERTLGDAEEVLAAMRRHGSLDHAAGLADRLADEGIARFESDLDVIPENEGKAVLRQIAHYVTTRPR